VIAQKWDEVLGRLKRGLEADEDTSKETT